ncbi:MAG: hypothetical protein CL678_07285 [Bdellovibrionaceae bacterium]|nr:hypothetical protein [Pseudobdellovibrionaceae bacterium]
MKILFILFCFILTPSFAQSIEEKIDTAIRMRHEMMPKEWWRSLGPQTSGILIEMFQKNAYSSRKLRLMQALAWFPDDPQAVSFLKDQAQQKEEVFQVAAIQTLGISQGVQEADFISSFLKNSNPQIRIAAAETLKKIGQTGDKETQKKISEKLDQWILNEPTDWVKNRYQKIPLKNLVKLRPGGSNLDLERLIDYQGDWVGQWLISQEKGFRLVPLEIKINKNDEWQVILSY